MFHTHHHHWIIQHIYSTPSPLDHPTYLFNSLKYVKTMRSNKGDMALSAAFLVTCWKNLMMLEVTTKAWAMSRKMQLPCVIGFPLSSTSLAMKKRFKPSQCWCSGCMKYPCQFCHDQWAMIHPSCPHNVSYTLWGNIIRNTVILLPNPMRQNLLVTSMTMMVMMLSLRILWWQLWHSAEGLWQTRMQFVDKGN